MDRVWSSALGPCCEERAPEISDVDRGTINHRSLQVP